MDLVAVHLGTALIGAASVVVVAVIAVSWALAGRPGRHALDRSLLLAFATLALAAASGVLVLAIGSPAVPLHVLYAVATPVALAAARYVGRARNDRARFWQAVGVLVALALLARTLTTG